MACLTVYKSYRLPGKNTVISMTHNLIYFASAGLRISLHLMPEQIILKDSSRFGSKVTVEDSTRLMLYQESDAFTPVDKSLSVGA